MDIQLESTNAKVTHQEALVYFQRAEEYAYKFIMKVREIRELQYYKALGFTSFDSYCTDAWGIKRSYMDERIQIAESFGNKWDFDRTYGQFGHSKSLLLIQIPSEQREQPHTIPSTGAVKTVDEMTVRELRARKRKPAQRKPRRITRLCARL